MRITCSNCQKLLTIDETKLPMREVSFPCPVCKAKLTVDRSKLEESGEAAAPAQAPAAAPQQSAPPPEDDHADEFGAKALLVGNDNAALRQAAKLIGFLPVLHTDPVKARDFFSQELPQVVFLNPPQLTAPPLDSMAPLLSVIPADRRKSFFVLFADNLRTLDGNAAFLYGVNLIVATKDIGQFAQIYREAYTAHERLYLSMNAVMKEKHLA